MLMVLSSVISLRGRFGRGVWNMDTHFKDKKKFRPPRLLIFASTTSAVTEVFVA